MANLPPWFERTLSGVLVGIASFGLLGVALAIVGVYHPLAAFVPAVVAAGAVGARWDARAGDRRRSTQAATAVMVIGALAIGVVNSALSTEALFGGRDPVLYAATGLWLSGHDDLTVETDRDAFPDDIEGLSLRGPGFSLTGDDDEALHFQFPHLFGVLLSLGAYLGGPAALLDTTAILGGIALLAMFALGARLVSPWLSAAASLAYGLGYPFAYFSRTPTAEIPTQLFLLGGAWLLLIARGRRQLWLRLPAGIVLGAAGATRIDAGLVLLGVLAFLLWEIAAAERTRRREQWRASLSTLGGMALGILLLWVDIRWFAPTYYTSLREQVAMLSTAAVLVTIAGLAFTVPSGWRARAGAWIRGRRHTLGVAAGAVVALLGLYVIALRPLVEQATIPTVDPEAGPIAELQRRQGLPVDGGRSYAEYSGRWLLLYLGPVGALGAVAAAAWTAARTVAGRASVAWGLFLAMSAPTAGLYLYDPHITADQPWAMRRFLVVALPAASLLFVAGAARIARNRHGSWASIRLAGAAGAIALLIGTSLYHVSDLRRAQLRPFAAVTSALCEHLTDDDAVLIVRPGGPEEYLETLGARYAMMVKVACDLPVASLDRAPDVADVDRFARHAREAGHRPIIVSPRPLAGRGISPERFDLVAEARGVPLLTSGLNARPREHLSLDFAVYAAMATARPAYFAGFGDGFDAPEQTAAGPGRWLRSARGKLSFFAAEEAAMVAGIRMRALATPQRVDVFLGERRLASATVPSERFVDVAVPLPPAAQGEFSLALQATPGPEPALAAGGTDRRRLAVRVLEEITLTRR